MRKWGEKDRYLCPGSLHIFNERVREESPTGETIDETRTCRTDVYSTSYGVRYKVCCCVGQMTI